MVGIVLGDALLSVLNRDDLRDGGARIDEVLLRFAGLGLAGCGGGWTNSGWFVPSSTSEAGGVCVNGAVGKIGSRLSGWSCGGS